jgi:hypothetical protein
MRMARVFGAECYEVCMRLFKNVAVLPLLIVAAACGREPAQTAAPDLSFLRELELAVSAPQGEAVISPLELRASAGEEQRVEAAPQPAAQPRAAAPRPAQSTARRTTSSGSSAASAPSAPVGRTVEVKNTRRDAAIGAGAGAVLGAVVAGPDRRVRGAVIGGAVGGATGAIVGSTINKSTRTVYDFN